WLPPPCDPLDEMTAVPQMGAPAPIKIMEIKNVDPPEIQSMVGAGHAPPVLGSSIPPARIVEIEKVDSPAIQPAVILASAPPKVDSTSIAPAAPPVVAASPMPSTNQAAVAGSPIPPTIIAQPKIDGPRMIVLFLRETGDRARDTRRLRILYGLLTSYPGADRFAFHISEAQRTYRLEFPANTTAWCAELERQVNQLVGTGCVEVQPWTVQ
ncbi:MAG: hypothetical protein ABSB78_14720, partial [Bacteroidota bacterium]